MQGTVLVLGATGETGWRTVANLRQKNFQVRVLIRNEQKAQSIAALNQSGVEQIQGDARSDADLQSALRGVSAVISVIGGSFGLSDAEIEATETTTMFKLIAVSLEAGIQHIVMCSSMGTEMPEAISQLTKILRAKRQAEIALEQSGIPFTIVRPGGLINDPGGEEVIATRRLMGFGRISRDDVAEVLVQALLQPEARGKIVEIIAQAGAGKANRPDLFATT